MLFIIPKSFQTNDIIITGGGGFFWENLRLLIKTSNLSPYLAIPARQANALGQYLYGEVRRRGTEQTEANA